MSFIKNDGRHVQVDPKQFILDSEQDEHEANKINNNASNNLLI